MIRLAALVLLVALGSCSADDERPPRGFGGTGFGGGSGAGGEAARDGGDASAGTGGAHAGAGGGSGGSRACSPSCDDGCPTVPCFCVDGLTVDGSPCDNVPPGACCHNDTALICPTACQDHGGFAG